MSCYHNILYKKYTEEDSLLYNKIILGYSQKNFFTIDFTIIYHKDNEANEDENQKKNKFFESMTISLNLHKYNILKLEQNKINILLYKLDSFLLQKLILLTDYINFLLIIPKKYLNFLKVINITGLKKYILYLINFIIKQDNYDYNYINMIISEYLIGFKLKN